MIKPTGGQISTVGASISTPTSTGNNCGCLWTAQVDRQRCTAPPLLVKGGQNSRTSEEEEEGFVPQANRPDKIRVEGAQLEPFRADPVLRLSHIPPYPSLSSLFPFSPFHHLPASSFPHLACHWAHFSLFFKQYGHVLGGAALIALLLLCGVPPPVLFLTASLPQCLSGTSVKWGQRLPCNAVSLLCFSAAL